ncbi:MAG: cupin domain-containing protein [Desulfofustis sp.]|nr:cupin domain-containing protein [Desulfofustis sp.]
MDVIREQHTDKTEIGPGRTRYLAHTDQLMMVVIDFTDGPTDRPDPPHTHPHEQVSYVARGRLLVHIGDQVSELGPGDVFTVAPNVPHTVQLLSPQVRLVDTFTPLRDEFIS